MHSALFLSVLATASIATAIPTSAEKRGLECSGSGAYYVCGNNGFRGYCSTDPCNKAWCSDYTAGTCDKWSTTTTTTSTTTSSAPCTSTTISTTTSPPATYTPGAECPGSGNYYVCANNGFRGYCSSDPCNLAWCPDFALSSCERIVRTTTAAVSAATSDPESETYEPAMKRDETVCPAGTGYFQSCGNGFRGCCKGDACGAKWCPDYKLGTFEPVSAPKSTTTTTSTWTTLTTAKPPVKTPSSDPTVCGEGKGYFQSCGNGFRGCCKQDACALGYCPAS